MAMKNHFQQSPQDLCHMVSLGEIGNKNILRSV